MICAHCDQPIREGQGITRTIDGASGPGGTVTVHREPCRRVDQPTVQQGRGVRRRW
jgi:hypothetical protein